MTDKRCGICRREGCGWQTPATNDDPAVVLRQQGIRLEDTSSVAAAIDERKILLKRNHEKLRSQHPLQMSPEKSENTEMNALIKEGHSLMGQLKVLGVPEKEIEELLHKEREEFPNWGAE